MRPPSKARAAKPASAPSRPVSSPSGRAPRKKKAAQPLEDQAPQDDTTPQVGAFGTALLAPSDIETEEEREAGSVETLPEMEREFGISDWIDPQTGEPAQGQSPPHLEEE